MTDEGIVILVLDSISPVLMIMGDVVVPFTVSLTFFVLSWLTIRFVSVVGQNDVHHELVALGVVWLTSPPVGPSHLVTVLNVFPFIFKNLSVK